MVGKWWSKEMKSLSALDPRREGGGDWTCLEVVQTSVTLGCTWFRHHLPYMASYPPSSHSPPNASHPFSLIMPQASSSRKESNPQLKALDKESKRARGPFLFISYSHYLCLNSSQALFLVQSVDGASFFVLSFLECLMVVLG